MGQPTDTDLKRDLRELQQRIDHSPEHLRADLQAQLERLARQLNIDPDEMSAGQDDDFFDNMPV